MLNFFDLYDLHAIFVNIRNNESNPLNGAIVTDLLRVIKNRNENFETNQFRVALQALDLSGFQEYSFVFTKNAYPYIPFLIKDERVYKLLEAVCEELLKVVNEQNHNQIIDLADVLHNLPLILSDNNLTIPNSFWNHEVKSYRKKWNQLFLSGFKQ